MVKELKKHNKKISLTCKECCRQMGDYIDGKLTVDEDILFVGHIRFCKDCAEEFHNYYNFMTNLYFLNYGYNDRFPASEEVLMKETEDTYFKYRKKHRAFATAIVLLILLIAILSATIVFQYFGGYF